MVFRRQLTVYWPYHLQRHRFVQQSEDPDLVLSAPFPDSRASLRRKLMHDLTGENFLQAALRPTGQEALGAPARHIGLGTDGSRNASATRISRVTHSGAN